MIDDGTIFYNHTHFYGFLDPDNEPVQTNDHDFWAHLEEFRLLSVFELFNGILILTHYPLC